MKISAMLKNGASVTQKRERGGRLGRPTHLPEAGRVDRLGVVPLAEVQVVHVQGTSRNADPLRDLVVLLQPADKRPVSKPQARKACAF